MPGLAGQNVVIGGLRAIQLVFFGFFIVVNSVFHGRLDRYSTHHSTGSVPGANMNSHYMQPGFLFSYAPFRLHRVLSG
ncbi:hypothetical protein V1517DRAFT_266436 [Lipomyces orientalis]|uniref:Uncharacterized protein n=1 Tax=Lipomyces orientalis TaxID=1233043 RepID=A0ACC3TF17_9ASCO